MWSDNEAVVDLLNVQHLVGAVLRVIKDDRLDPVTVGVFGDWGSGKSSVIQLLRQRMAAEPELLAVYFNGWRFEGYEDAKAALASTILEQIQEEAEKPTGGKLTRVKDTVVESAKGFWGRIDKLRLGKQFLTVGANAGIAAGAVALGATAVAPLTAAALVVAVAKSLGDSGKEINGEKLAELIKEREAAESKEQRETHVSIRDFHKEFGELVSKLGVKRLVVVVDDLDRCLRHNVIETLEAIRLFLAAPKTAFVIAADEALIREAVAYRFPEVPATGGADNRPRASVGARYTWGGNTPESGFDCSGFTKYVFAKQGVALPRTSREQARAGQGVALDYAAFLPGDILLFAEPDAAVSHVAIYVGDGRIIHASSVAGAVSYLDLQGDRGAWYVQNLVAVRRLTGNGRSLLQDSGR